MRAHYEAPVNPPLKFLDELSILEEKTSDGDPDDESKNKGMAFSCGVIFYNILSG